MSKTRYENGLMPREEYNKKINELASLAGGISMVVVNKHRQEQILNAMQAHVDAGVAFPVRWPAEFMLLDTELNYWRNQK